MPPKKKHFLSLVFFPGFHELYSAVGSFCNHVLARIISVEGSFYKLDQIAAPSGIELEDVLELLLLALLLTGPLVYAQEVELRASAGPHYVGVPIDIELQHQG